MSRRRAHYVVSTHWDREWYQNFQDYRYRLVQLIDHLFDGWQNELLQGSFQTDGQAIVLEDYLEVRPERREQVKQLVKDGRLAVGPWYVMPDEFLVSGESLIRNLRLGRRLAREWGGAPSDAGFVCDIFGHNSQMPQIFSGFGIRGGFIWRGTNSIDTRVLRWRGADGTELPCYRFGRIGYCSYAVQVRQGQPSAPEPFAPELINARLDAYLREEAARTPVDPLLLFDGGDHMEWDARAYAVLAERFGQPGEEFEIVHTSLDAYLDEMAPQAGRAETVLEGELREPGRDSGDQDHQWLIPGVTSSRVWIKQDNAACQALLCQWAEPLSACAHAALGLAYPQGYLDVAWKWLIMNHPHDSICGCSIDAVHEDMRYRFAQARHIAHCLTVEAARKVAASVEGCPREKELRVAVFNPLPVPLKQVAELTLDIPADWPLTGETMGGFDPQPGFFIQDAQGQDVAYQRLSQARHRAHFRIQDTRFPQAYQVNAVRVSLPLNLPALGYTTLTVRAGEPGRPTRQPAPRKLATSERTMENERLCVTIEINGTLTLHDKQTGRAYARLLTFEDSADIGDGWNYGPAVNDQCFVSSACRSSVALVHNGPLQATFRVRTVLDVPAEFDWQNMARAEQMAGLVIDSRLTLRAGADRVEVETTVHNTVKDHRLRVLFPSGAQAKTYLADTPFDVVERSIALREDNYLYREMEVETKPQQTWTSVSGADGGLATISAGLLESAVIDAPERTIALTLLRSTSRTVFTDGEPQGQLQGELKFHYWIVPLAHEPDRARLCQLGQELAGGVYDAQLTAQDVAQHKMGAALPSQASWLSVAGPAVVTSLQHTPHGVEVRMFNPNSFTAQVTLDLSGWPGAALTQAQPVNLESCPVGQPLPAQGGRVALELAPKKILTLRVTQAV